MKFNRWHVYCLLKGVMKPSKDYIKSVNEMDPIEIKEGLIEFLLARERTGKEYWWQRG